LNKRKKNWICTAFYGINLLAVILIIALMKPSPDINIMLSLYLIMLTGFFSYAMAHQSPKK